VELCYVRLVSIFIHYLPFLGVDSLPGLFFNLNISGDTGGPVPVFFGSSLLKLGRVSSNNSCLLCVNDLVVVEAGPARSGVISSQEVAKGFFPPLHFEFFRVAVVSFFPLPR